jgi:RNA polymerase sigma factor (TIGR02999 family)
MAGGIVTMQPDSATLASLAQRAQAGDAQAHDQLFALLYARLHRLAHSELRRHGQQVTLSTTTLLHEAYLDIHDRDALAFPDEGRFLAYAARAMRGLVIDRVRERGTQKRGGAMAITSLDTENAEQCLPPELLPQIGDALDELAVLQPELAHVVDLKFFCGYTVTEIAALKHTSERTVQRQWEKARVLLYRALQPG